MNKYRTSTDERISQATIDRRRSLAYKVEAEQLYSMVCQGCNIEWATDHSHIISQANCKVLGKAELIYEPKNWFRSCRECHHIWENKKSGKFGNLKNIDELLTFLEIHDPEEYRKRMIYLENYKSEKLDK